MSGVLLNDLQEFAGVPFDSKLEFKLMPWQEIDSFGVYIERSYGLKRENANQLLGLSGFATTGFRWFTGENREKWIMDIKEFLLENISFFESIRFSANELSILHKYYNAMLLFTGCFKLR